MPHISIIGPRIFIYPFSFSDRQFQDLQYVKSQASKDCMRVDGVLNCIYEQDEFIPSYQRCHYKVHVI